jgi:PAS domain S-box-containing protein
LTSLSRFLDACPQAGAAFELNSGEMLYANAYFVRLWSLLDDGEKAQVRCLLTESSGDLFLKGVAFKLSPLEDGQVILWASSHKEAVASDSLAKMLLDVMPVPLVMTSLQTGRILFVNEPAAQMVGLGETEMIGRLASDFYAVPEDRARMVYDLTENGRVQDYETMFRHAQGRSISVIFSAILFDFQGEPGILAAITDISRRKEMEEIVRASEERYRTIIDSTSEGFWMIDGGTRVTLDVNQSLCDMLGYCREDLVGEQPLDFVDEGNRAEMLEQVERILATEQCDFDIELRSSDGRNIPCHFKAARFIDPLFHSLQAFAFITDITPRKEAEKALKEAKDEALAAAKARADFLAVMSHEIRTPMNGVLGMAKLLLDLPLDDRQRNCAETIQHSGQALMVLLNDILDLSKVEAGKLALENIPFDIVQLFDELHKLMAPRAYEKRLQLLKRVDNGLPRYLIGDPSRLRQILLNLLSNALKFTERGAITLAADYLGERDGAAHVRLSVADTGIGIDGDVQKLLFRDFAQADASIARRFGGTGLGLAISARLAEAMGGKIEISSQTGQGSLFWIDLLLPVAEALPDVEETTLHVPSLTILVAEDNAINRQVISGILEARGHTVLLVEDGQQAVMAVEMGHFDVVLMDGWMPLLDGIEATKRIRSLADPDKAAIPIIAMTANVSQSDVQSYLAAGMNDALGKPIELDRLDRALLNVSKKALHNSDAAALAQGQASSSDNEPNGNWDRLDTEILDQLLEVLGLDKLDEGFANLPQHWRDRSADIQKAGHDRDWNALARLAHDLKGTSGSFGLAGLSAYAKLIEAKGKAKSEEGLDYLLIQLPDAVEKSLLAIQEWRVSKAV